MDSLMIIEYVLLATSVVGLVTFVITYMVGSNWRGSLVGRYIMYFMMTMAGTFGYILFSPILQSFDVLGKRVVDIIVLIILNYGAWKLTWLLRKIQKGKYDERKSEDTTEENLQ